MSEKKKVGEIFTITRNDMSASNGYATQLVRLENLAVIYV
jgi:hypothetical protein